MLCARAGEETAGRVRVLPGREGAGGRGGGRGTLFQGRAQGKAASMAQREAAAALLQAEDGHGNP